jgi:hypothetical protein
MTPGIDKTTRGIFSKATLGLDEWNDRRDYRIVHEQPAGFINQFFGRKSSAVAWLDDIFILSPFEQEIRTVIHMDNSANEAEESNECIRRYFPETKAAKEYLQYQSFGMWSEDGRCDCCGNPINILNSNVKYSMCHECDKDRPTNHIIHGLRK